MADLVSQLQFAATIAPTFTPVVAVVGFLLTIVQIQRGARQHRVTLLMDIQKRWEADELKEPRAALTDLLATVRATITVAEAPSLEAQHRLAEERVTAHLRSLRVSNAAEHRKIMRVCDFFEVVGYAVRQRYLAERDIIQTFGGTILGTGYLEKHVVELQEAYSDKEYYKYFLDLVRATRKRTGNAHR